MKSSATDRLGTEHRKKTRRISILNDAPAPTFTVPTPQNPLFEGRWV
jgi:hypothetical protein